MNGHRIFKFVYLGATLRNVHVEQIKTSKSATLVARTGPNPSQHMLTNIKM